MGDQFKNFIIGLFVIAACAIIIFMILFLHPYIGDEGKIMHVRFIDIDKVNIGTRVTYAGRPVGEVTAIHELKNARINKLYDNNEVYVYELTLRIDSGVNVYTTDKISVRTSGLLGERSIEISPRAPSEGVATILVTDQTLYATNPESIDEVIQAVAGMIGKASGAIDLITEQIEELKSGEFIKNMNLSMKNIEEITTALNQPENLSEIIVNFHQLSDDLNQLQQRIANSWTDADAAIKNFREISTTIHRGEGSVGRFIASDDFYLRTTAVMSKAQTLMDDINHYGLLFQNDKNWQRLRARRVNLMNKLASPQQFKNFFEDEVNDISTALSRLSIVIGEHNNPCSHEIFHYNPEFSKVFANFLKRVELLEENLKMYDQQLMEREEKRCCGESKNREK